MSRLPRYIDSLNKFVKERSCISKIYSNIEQNNTVDPEDLQIITKINDSEVILPILFLTIMNSQNKKQKITAQGYYASTSILFLSTIINFMENKEILKQNTLRDLIMYTNKSIIQNLDNTKHLISGSDMVYILNMYSAQLSKENLLSDIVLQSNNLPLISDISKLFIENHEKSDLLKQNYSKIIQVTKDSYDQYIDKKYGVLCEIAFCTSWIIGCGPSSDILKIKRLSKQFSIIYKICMDFENLENDLLNISPNHKSKNYVINFGIQESCDVYLGHKQKFIENCMLLKIYSSTIKEILNYIQKKVDYVLDQTTPDLKSNFTL